MTSTADKDTGDLWQVEMKGHRQRDYWEAEAGTTVGTRSKKKKPQETRREACTCGSGGFLA